MPIRYELPRSFAIYDRMVVVGPLTAARAAMLALTQMPYQRSWADDLQRLQLKREVAGTSPIEGAEFTEQELDAALQLSPEALATRSQRQAAAAVATYLSANLEWPTQITETEFFKRVKAMPKGKVYGFLSSRWASVLSGRRPASRHNDSRILSRAARSSAGSAT
jgi:hypothetical protein